jgi:hypothetical protein
MPRPTKVSEPLADRRSTTENLKAELERLMDEQVLAEGLVERLHAERQGKLLSLPDGEMEIYDQQIAAAQRKLDRASAQIELVQRAYNEALDRESEAPKVEAYNQALRRSLAVRKRLESEYPELASTLGAMLSELRDCEIEVTRANAKLPRGAKPILSPEAALRNRGYDPRVLVEERIVERWVNSNRMLWRRDGDTGELTPPVLDAALAAQVIHGGRRSGRLPTNGQGHGVEVELRRVKEQIWKLSTSPVTQKPLAEAVRLPRLRPEDADPWMPDGPSVLAAPSSVESTFVLIEETASAETEAA